MRIGISAYDMTATDLLQLATAADATGFDTLWLGEHLFLPVAYGAEHPTSGGDAHKHHTGPVVSPETELLDPLVELAAVAGATRRIRLATGIFILPLRHPLATAQAVATLQEVSGGRFLFGIGFGWLQEEFVALGIPFDERVGRFQESIEVMRAAWSGGPFEHHGAHFTFDPVQVTSRPVHVPLILGGNSPKALRRAARLGDGWFSSGTPNLDEAQRLRDELHRLRAEAGRSGPFHIFVRVEPADPAVLERYAAAGFDDVAIWADQLWAPGRATDPHAALATAADALGVSVAPNAPLT
jgi:probable F420-dependent oxidoreductase